MSALTSENDRRGVGRHALPKPVPATYGGFPAILVEFSLNGCRIEHVDRVTPRATLPLRFAWRGAEVRIQSTLVRSEMIPVRGKPGYTSGLEFVEPVDAGAVVLDIVKWLIDAAAKKGDAHSAHLPAAKAEVEAAATNEPADAIPPLPLDAEVEDEEAETLSAPYLQCILSGGRWEKLYVDKPQQPAEGFTILAVSNEREVDVLCRAYQSAGVEARLAMRASFEFAISRSKR
ncbi:MAG: hypothetical protein ACXVIJ_07125 [Thermoanaerobaculia bacterium]